VDERSGRKRICAFLVDADLEGVSTHPLKNKYGFRPLSTGELVLEDVRVPADALLGEEGQGFEIAMNSVENGRLGVAARAVGLSQACCDVAIAYAKERRVFKQPIGKFQLVQEMISNTICGTEGARLLTLRLAHLKDRGDRAGARRRWPS
jgi:alkylation response protein AidB-like acyl-CoA dehydrogenase